MICTHRHSRTGSVYTRRGTPAPGGGAPPLAVGYLTSTYTVLPVTVVVGWSAPGTPESVRAVGLAGPDRDDRGLVQLAGAEPVDDDVVALGLQLADRLLSIARPDGGGVSRCAQAEDCGNLDRWR